MSENPPVEVVDLTKTAPEPDGSIRRRKVASVRIPPALYPVVELTGEDLDALIQSMVDQGAEVLRQRAAAALKGGA